MSYKIIDMASLKKAYDQNLPLKYLFFWSNDPQKGLKSALSQWSNHPFPLDDVTYPSAEHYMMAQKALLFNDRACYEKIISSSHPNAAKKLGREVMNFDEEVWIHERFAIVVKGNYAKFSHYPELKTFLIKTQERVLVEASPRDTIWGVGLSEHESTIYNPHLWKGENLLGFALMQVREMLKI